jgi:hypothetical protein
VSGHAPETRLSDEDRVRATAKAFVGATLDNHDLPEGSFHTDDDVQVNRRVFCLLFGLRGSDTRA